jgi:hypothetical protein
MDDRLDLGQEFFCQEITTTRTGGLKVLAEAFS